MARWLWGVWNEKQSEGEQWGQGKVGRVIELGQTVELEVRFPSPSSRKEADLSSR